MDICLMETLYTHVAKALGVLLAGLHSSDRTVGLACYIQGDVHNFTNYSMMYHFKV